jgi:hypothetical protein
MNGSVDDTGKPLARASSDASHVRIIALASRIVEDWRGLRRTARRITYVSRQPAHKDASITLRVYAHWLPDLSTVRAVDLLDDAQPPATQRQPAQKSVEWRNGASPYGAMVSRGGIEPPTRRLRVCCSAN